MSTTSPTTYQLFLCGHNMAGYMPEADVVPFTSWSAAKQYLIDEMERASDSIETGSPDPWGETYAEGLCASMQDLNLSSGPDWSDIIDAGEHAAASWWIVCETFADRDAVYQYVSSMADVDDETADDIMSTFDDVETDDGADDQPDQDDPDVVARQDAGRFFRKHAGYAVLPGETDDAARARCATDLVNAERWAHDAGVTFDWSPDWTVSDHKAEFACYDDGGPTTCETCTCYSSDGTVLASLSCIDDATDDYRRVVEAELASEAMGPVVHRLDAGDDNDQPTDSTRALLFGVLADLSAPTVSHYRSDWYHDARWIREHVSSAPFTFAYSWDEAGTSIGVDVEHVAYRRHAVLVTLVYERFTFRASVERLK